MTQCMHGQYDCIGIESSSDSVKESMGIDSYRCRSCWKVFRQEHLQKGIVSPFYVVVTEVTRRYGGPEEGKWYFDWLSILEVIKVYNFKQALKAAHEMRSFYPKPKYDRFSVLGDSDYFINTYYDVSQFPQESTEVPIYE